MERSLLNKIICPTIVNGSRCGGRLFLHEDEVGPLFHGENQEEIIEGALCCSKCGMFYPVLLGVPVLLDGIRSFLRYGIKLIAGFIETHGKMRSSMRKFINNEILRAMKHKDEPVAPISTEYKGMTADGMAKYIAVYLDTHFGDREKSAGNHITRQINGILRSEKDPPGAMVEMAGNHLETQDPVGLDLGCSVGGLTYRLAPLCREIIGVDLSFEKIFYARGILKHLPERISTYPRYHEGSYFEEIPIPIEKLDHAEFLVASAENLPFEDSSFDLLTSANLVDIVNDPLKLIAEKERLLREEGLCVISTPFLYNSATVVNHFAVNKKQPVQVLKDLLAPTFEFLEEIDNLPWLMRHADRKYELLYDFVLAARKKIT